MPETPDQIERWQFGGRYYLPTYASTPTTMDLEVEDVGPGIGRGIVLIASRDDDTAEISLQSFSDTPLPIALIEQTISDARASLPPEMT